MKRCLLMLASTVFMIAIMTGSARADFHLELVEAGENMFQVDLWADPESPELNFGVQQVQVKIDFTDFVGLTGFDLVINEIIALNGFVAFGSAVGQDLSTSRTFNVLNFSGIQLNDRDSPMNSLPILTVGLDAAAAGSYTAAVLDPDGLLDQTSVNVDTSNVQGSSAPTQLSAVPEPSAFAMIGVVAAAGYGIIFIRRRLRGTN